MLGCVWYMDHFCSVFGDESYIKDSLGVLYELESQKGSEDWQPRFRMHVLINFRSNLIFGGRACKEVSGKLSRPFYSFFSNGLYIQVPVVVVMEPESQQRREDCQLRYITVAF